MEGDDGLGFERMTPRLKRRRQHSGVVEDAHHLLDLFPLSWEQSAMGRVSVAVLLQGIMESAHTLEHLEQPAHLKTFEKRRCEGGRTAQSTVSAQTAMSARWVMYYPAAQQAVTREDGQDIQ